MTNNNDYIRPSRDGRKRGIRQTLPGTIPKKTRGRSDSNGSRDGQWEEEGAVIENEEELLDPVAAAKKALEMFEEVSGEPVVHKTARVIETGGQRNSDEQQRYDEHTNGKISDQAERSEPGKQEQAEEKMKVEEEKARQKKRIEAGEAKRREFRPKIVGLQDSNCLL